MRTSPTESSAGDIHPAFKRSALGLRVARIAVALALLTVIGGAVVLFSIAGRGESFGNLAGLAILPMVLPFVFLWRMIGRHGRLIRRASQVLSTGTPRRMQFKPLGISELDGLYVALWPEGRYETGRPQALASIVANKRGVGLPPPGESVDIWLEPGPDGFLVFQSSRGTLWGSLASAESIDMALRRQRRFALLMGTTLVLSLVGLGVGGQQQIARMDEILALAQASRNWPVAQAEILASTVESVRLARGKSSVPGFRAVIRYAYTPRGEGYREERLDGERIHFGYRPSEDRGEASRLVDAYPAGAQVEVLFHPHNPALAVLEPGHEEDCQRQLDRIRLAFAVPLGLGVLILLVMAVVVSLVLRRKRRRMADLLNGQTGVASTGHFG